MFADEPGEWEVTYMEFGQFHKQTRNFASFEAARKWAKSHAKRHGDTTVYRDTPSRVYMATYDSRGNRRNPEKKNSGRGNPPEYLESDSAYNAGELMAEMYNSIRVRPGRETFLSGFNKWFNKWKHMGVTGSKANAQQSFEAGFRAKYRLSNEGRGNPSTSEAETIARGFHGRAVKEVFDIEEEESYLDELAVLGCLVELNVTQDDKFSFPIRFSTKKNDEVYVAAANKHSIEFVGGDQKIINIAKIASHVDKPLVRVGKVDSIVYLTDKYHLVGSNGRKEEYEHEFGKKKFFSFSKKRIGKPELIYDTVNCTLKLVGGSYTVEDEGIKD